MRTTYVMTRLVIAAAAWLAACNVNPYDLSHGSGSGSDASMRTDAGQYDDGGLFPDAAGIDAVPPDACIPSPEVCNDKDDDCDGVADNGFDKTKDPNNCGTCGMQCVYTNQLATCENSACKPGDCKPGWHDLKNDPPTDCSYFCIQTNGGSEDTGACDHVDNDCDGKVDETYNTQTDVNNCGSCGNICNLNNATPACNAGICEVMACKTGFVDADKNPVNGCEYQCTKTNGGVEVCDGIDNNCDGVVDDGNPGGGGSCSTGQFVCTPGTQQCQNGHLFCIGEVDGVAETCNDKDDDCNGVADNGFDKTKDVNNCGACGTVCAFTNAGASCASSACKMGTCTTGFFDINKDPSDGCEYACTKTGAETCNNVDDDCDGVKDNGFDKTKDVNNCGSCGHVCSFTNASATCSNSACAMGTCNANFYDINKNPADGCEYGCIKSNGGVEKCDGLDNDCNGTIDDGDPGGNTSCGSNTGTCTFGTNHCVGGKLVCQGGQGPVGETCNNLDDDCNGTADNGFDKLSDPRYCNNCAGCALDHAVAGCSAGKCTVAQCLQGYVDLDKSAANGCEYKCTASGVEVCDGVDNDCDNKIDETLTTPSNFCKTLGPCAGTAPTCAGAAGWDCVYTSPDVEKNASGDPVTQEDICDDKDNDCDGKSDEFLPLKDTACAEDGTFGTTRKLGICRGTGALKCNAQHNGLACTVTVAGKAAVDEKCNNLDDDCDGHVDEPYDATTFLGVREALVGPLSVGGKNVMMYKYEASKPDASAGGPGLVQTRSCSNPSVIPWGNPTLAQAQGACAAAGMRLCKVTRDGSGNVTADEWGRFCASASNRIWPYGNSYAPNTCNGSDYDPVAGGVNEDFAIATNTLGACLSVDGGVDMSGNLKEFVDDPRTVGGQTVYTLRGGSYDNHDSNTTTAHALGCSFDLTVVPTSYQFANTGFRCCAIQCAAGQVECNGVCKDLASDAANCGACGSSCGAGKSCSNGYCCATGTQVCKGTDTCAATCPP